MKQASTLLRVPIRVRACLEAGFDSEKRQLFGDTRRLFEERPQRYGQKKQRSITEKGAFAAQRLASKQALKPK
ncbi:MAG: hypothetical protein H6564_22180 [Lewinellaceae bacterium]|nr:hypothetical protein [Lewinellaceae bacterium]